ncbi:hydroxyisourate hydrolase [Prochlorothrix hollandica]|uniref:5-hydroxyisourate hydrolase n=1 Tax=Prochlorothrix hollandica PCC 9006 = CALU 1027 TaxID=317619 RepID=A0A0M2Q4J0_PROHO|nr:hydroxyisourate hydrolase [Prochlorothrix hollandica]KKJ01497.1 5-hydroxyisourate hydrolase [Prochlorothrix hollandica PCC 9006 = CALU 1027]
MTGRLTTYILDTTQGCPAANLGVELWILDPRVESQTQLLVTHTNDRGTTDEPLIMEPELETGTYELIFLVGDYFRHQGVVLDKPPFLTEIPIRFGMADTAAHYHIALLISPWAYSVSKG